ncbi:hypothetical protein MTR_4g106530 [Medicago truncatula]|nr:hypothetical protein MTR_4g106530 [Medicago truncatula]
MEYVPPSPPESLPFNTVWFHLHGYGYDPINDDYKIIRHEVYLNGLCHWWAYTNVADPYMVSFNLSDDNFLTTHLPLDMQDSYPDEWVKERK